MTFFTEMFFPFFVQNFPPLNIILIGGPLGILWAYICLYISGYLKMKKGFKTGYTRKIFHFLIFMSVVVVQWVWGTSVMCLFGGMASLVILYSLIRGKGNLLYEAIAREADEPHRTLFIVIPYFATFVGGVLGNIFFGQAAVIGYLATGLGDAVGEPVGTRFGKHRYSVLSMFGVKAWRSLEGSTAVFITCMIAVTIGISLTPQLQLSIGGFFWIPIIGLVCTVIEAICPHGLDNTFLQLVPSFMAVILL